LLIDLGDGDRVGGGFRIAFLCLYQFPSSFILTFDQDWEFREKKSYFLYTPAPLHPYTLPKGH
jgi:hypothetical protein